MSRPIILVLAASAALLAASPCLAFSMADAPTNPNSGARIVDPDKTMPHLAPEDGVNETRNQVPVARGPVVVYDLTAASKTVSPRQEDLLSKVSDLASPQFNPFMGDSH